MRVKSLLCSKKTITGVTGWKVGNGPGSAFPLRKGLIYGSLFSWRVISMNCGGVACRLLIACNPIKYEHQVMLGVETPGGMVRVVAIVENHGTHPGWHLHGVCNDSGVTTGVLRQPGLRRMKAHWGHTNQPTSKEDVLAAAMHFFRMPDALAQYSDAPV